MSVSTRPGWMEVTRTMPRSSSRRAWVSARSAYFDAAYTPPLAGVRRNPDPELIMMTSPWLARSSGSTRRVRSATAMTLISNTRRHSSRGWEPISPGYVALTPALLIRTSRWSSWETAVAVASSSVRSTTKGEALGSSDTTLSTASWWRPPTMMWWSRPSSSAMARPMPRVAPVTRTLLAPWLLCEISDVVGAFITPPYSSYQERYRVHHGRRRRRRDVSAGCQQPQASRPRP